MRHLPRRSGWVAVLSVLGLCAAGMGPLSGVVQAAPSTDLAVAAAPTIGSAVPGDRSATVSWTAPVSDGGAAITGYVVTPYVGYVPLRPSTFHSVATTQVVPGLTNGTPYRFRVQALNAVGTSGYSKVTQAVTPLPAYYVVFDGQSLNFYGGYPWKLMAAHPGVPFTNACTGGSSWTALAATAADRVHSLANRGLTTILIMNGGTSDLLYEHDDGQTLYADERSYAESARAAGFDVVIGTTTTPAETFTATMDAERLVANGLLLANADAAFDHTVDFDADLRPGLSLHDSADAAAYPDGVHWSAAAAQVAADLVDERLSSVFGPATVPGPVTIGSAVAGDGSATVSWTAPASDGGSPITGYVVRPYVGAVAQTPIRFDSPATVQTITGLANSVRHSFTVAAINAVGTGAESAASNAVAPSAALAVPEPPTIIRNATAGDGEVTLSWTAPGFDGGSPVIAYVVTPYVGYAPRPSRTFDSPATTQTITGLTNGTEYRFRVQALNAVGLSRHSTVTNPVTPTA